MSTRHAITKATSVAVLVALGLALAAQAAEPYKAAGSTASPSAPAPIVDCWR